jgi:hypothetical protein
MNKALKDLREGTSITHAADLFKVEVVTVLGCCAALAASCLPTFWNNTSNSSSRVKQSKYHKYAYVVELLRVRPQSQRCSIPIHHWERKLSGSKYCLPSSHRRCSSPFNLPLRYLLPTPTKRDQLSKTRKQKASVLTSATCNDAAHEI